MAKHEPSLTLMFQALADPTRRAILAQLGQGALAVSALAHPTGYSMPTILRHLGVLEDAGLIQSEKSGRVRLCRVCPAAFAPVAAWLDARRADWEAQTDRLEAYAQSLTKGRTHDL